MKRFFLASLFLLISFSTYAQFNAAKTAVSQKSVQDKYMTFITDKGYSPEVDKDGDIKFTYNGRTYYITIDSKDKQFFRIMRLANLKLSSEERIMLAKKICHDITVDVKMTKVYWYNDMIWTSSELLLPDPNDYEKVFDRVLRLTESTYVKFVDAWKEAN